MNRLCLFVKEEIKKSKKQEWNQWLNDDAPVKEAGIMILRITMIRRLELNKKVRKKEEGGRMVMSEEEERERERGDDSDSHLYAT